MRERRNGWKGTNERTNEREKKRAEEGAGGLRDEDADGTENKPADGWKIE